MPHVIKSYPCAEEGRQADSMEENAPCPIGPTLEQGQ
jgi:hypothetical protein